MRTVGDELGEMGAVEKSDRSDEVA